MLLSAVATLIGTVVGAGISTSGQLDVSSWTDIVQVAAGANHTVGLKADGTVMAVGINIFGELDVAYPQVTVEEIVARRPEVILEAAPGVDADVTAGMSGQWKSLMQVCGFLHDALSTSFWIIGTPVRRFIRSPCSAQERREMTTAGPLKSNASLNLAKILL